MKKLRSMKGSGTLIVTISAIVFLIYATSTFSDVKHLKYMQEKYEEDIKELYENDLKLIDLDATDELNIDYEIQLYSTDKAEENWFEVNIAGAALGFDVYISVNRSDEEIAEIKYERWNGVSETRYESDEGFNNRYSKYDAEYFQTEDNGKSIKSSFKEGKYKLKARNAYSYGTYIIYVRDIKGNEKTIDINLLYYKYILTYLSYDKSYRDENINESVQYIMDLYVQGTYEGSSIQSRVAGSNTGIYKPNGTSMYSVQLKYSYDSDPYGGFLDQKLGIEADEAITSLGKENGIDEEKVVYKFYVSANRSVSKVDGAYIKYSDAFIKYNPFISVSCLDSNKDLYYFFIDSKEQFMDWSDVEYRDGYGYYSKSTGEYYGDGNYWHVFDYYANTGELKIVNKIVSTQKEI